MKFSFSARPARREGASSASVSRRRRSGGARDHAPPAEARGRQAARVVLHPDYLDYAAVERAFAGVDACLFCLGISVSQVSGEAEYRRITHGFALAAVRALERHSPAAAFHFISGQGARLDSRMMWARVKAETERDLMDFTDAVCWRPAFIDGETSQSGPRLYQAIRPLFRLLKGFRGFYVAGEDIGRAMLQATIEGIRGRIIENAEIRDLASRSGLRVR